MVVWTGPNGANSYCGIASRGTNMVALLETDNNGDANQWWSTNGGSTWSSVTAADGAFILNPMIISPDTTNNTLMVVGKGSDNYIYWKYYNGSSWTNWASLGGGHTTLSGTTCAISTPGSGYVDLVMIESTASHCYYNQFNGTSWSGYTDIGGTCLTTPSICSVSASIRWAMVIGTDNNVYYNHYTGGAWGAWNQITGATTASRPVLIYDNTNGMIAAINDNSGNNYIWTANFASGSWGTFAKPTAGGQGTWISMSLRTTGKVVLLIKGIVATDTKIYYQESSSGSFSAGAWSTMTMPNSGYIGNYGIASCSDATDGTVDVVCLDSGGIPHFGTWNGTSWSGFTDLATNDEGAVTTCCTIEFTDNTYYRDTDSFPSSGTTLTNQGSGGSSYNGTSSGNYHNRSTYGGCDCWNQNTATTQYTTVPAGTLTNNLKFVTIEAIVWYTNSYASYATIYSKATTSSGSVYGFNVYIDGLSHEIVVNRTWQSTTTYAQWTGNTNISTGWHMIQVSWDMSSSGNPPVAYVDGTAQTMTAATNGTWSSYWDDSSQPGYVGNDIVYATAGASATYEMFRLHNAALNAGTLTTNYNATKWRYDTHNVRIGVSPVGATATNVAGTTATYVSEIDCSVPAFSPVMGSTSTNVAGTTATAAVIGSENITFSPVMGSTATNVAGTTATAVSEADTKLPAFASVIGSTSTNVAGTTATKVSEADCSVPTFTSVIGATSTNVAGTTAAYVSQCDMVLPAFASVMGSTATNVAGTTATYVSRFDRNMPAFASVMGSNATNIAGTTATYVSRLDNNRPAFTSVMGATATNVAGTTATYVSEADCMVPIFTSVIGATATNIAGTTATKVSRADDLMPAFSSVIGATATNIAGTTATNVSEADTRIPAFSSVIGAIATNVAGTTAAYVSQCDMVLPAFSSVIGATATNVAGTTATYVSRFDRNLPAFSSVIGATGTNVAGTTATYVSRVDYNLPAFASVIGSTATNVAGTTATYVSKADCTVPIFSPVIGATATNVAGTTATKVSHADENIPAFSSVIGATATNIAGTTATKVSEADALIPAFSSVMGAIATNVAGTTATHVSEADAILPTFSPVIGATTTNISGTTATHVSEADCHPPTLSVLQAAATVIAGTIATYVSRADDIMPAFSPVIGATATNIGGDSPTRVAGSDVYLALTEVLGSTATNIGGTTPTKVSHADENLPALTPLTATATMTPATASIGISINLSTLHATASVTGITVHVREIPIMNPLRAIGILAQQPPRLCGLVFTLARMTGYKSPLLKRVEECGPMTTYLSAVVTETGISLTCKGNMFVLEDGTSGFVKGKVATDEWGQLIAMEYDTTSVFKEMVTMIEAYEERMQAALTVEIQMRAKSPTRVFRNRGAWVEIFE